MRLIEYMSNYAIVIFLFIVIIIGLIEKKKVFDLFKNGALDGTKLVVKLFPTLLGLMVAVNILTSSKIIEYVSNIIYPLLNFFGIDKELTGLVLLRPISGSTTTAIVTQIMKKYGPDSRLRSNFINYNGINRNNNFCCNIVFIKY